MWTSIPFVVKSEKNNFFIYFPPRSLFLRLLIVLIKPVFLSNAFLSLCQEQSAKFCITSKFLKLQVALVTFATFSLVNINNPNERLTADKAFVALSLFNVLRFPLATLPTLISSLVQASVSLKRLRDFLKSNELTPNNVKWRQKPASGNKRQYNTLLSFF